MIMAQTDRDYFVLTQIMINVYSIDRKDLEQFQGLDIWRNQYYIPKDDPRFSWLMLKYPNLN